MLQVPHGSLSHISLWELEDLCRAGGTVSFLFLSLTHIADLLWHCYNCIHQFPTAAIADTL